MLKVEISGGAKVFVNEYGKGKNKRVMYTLCLVGVKGEDDKYINHYIPVNFSKKLQDSIDKIDEESFDITIKDAWFSCYKDKDNHTHLTMFVNKAVIPEP